MRCYKWLNPIECKLIEFYEYQKTATDRNGIDVDLYFVLKDFKALFSVVLCSNT